MQFPCLQLSSLNWRDACEEAQDALCPITLSLPFTHCLKLCMESLGIGSFLRFGTIGTDMVPLNRHWTTLLHHYQTGNRSAFDTVFSIIAAGQRPKPHHNASGFCYINNRYSHLGGLTPILDSMVWPEDAVYYPPEAPAGGPEYGYVLMACRILILSFVTRHFSNLPR
jgi:hypothetical protein